MRRAINVMGFVLVVGLAGSAWAQQARRNERGTAPIIPVTAQELLTRVRDGKARVTVVNLWATFCQPCVEEFPDLVRLEKAYRNQGVRVFFVSADFDSDLPAVRRFLQKHGVTYPTFLKAQDDDNAFITTLHPDWSGALPATFIYDAQGRLRHFHEGKGDFALFERLVQEVLRNPNPE
ncbi:MAG: TlpA family protein disulfide reductase [Blastocatellia bacterium]|nr:TlpA family protein disulfide reductase [Blastocatellia bacterium]MCS7156689.1 TlpA family protein disulfide reductase [Blastocatellia bacterium]MCX7751569.1 TlpA family protein disulfide reductase [Blastocatellia bacterium]MDW8168669.1 TlpA disulfide reductase family protein [Acidobacteriota bacterium]MDW8256563.1 TlpA disulfide reductase family protein [Acidobacteriota bacterium]